MSKFLSRRRSGGVIAVEMGLTITMFLVFVFGMIELSRALFLWSSMAEVTRRAARGAANADFTSSAQLSDVKSRAMLNIGAYPNSSHLQVDYLNANLETPSPFPACPARNIAACTQNSSGAGCIRFVRVRLCNSGGASCSQLDYQSMVGQRLFPSGGLRFPTFATVTPAGTLGYVPGSDTNCN